MSMPAIDDATIDELYRWLQRVPFSRPVRNFARDFADGVLVAELVAHFLPRYVTLSAYTPANSTALKRYNWETMNKMVFAHLDYQLPGSLMQKVMNAQPGAAEYLLLNVRTKLEEVIAEGRFRPGRKHHHRSRSSSRAGSQLSLTDDSAAAPLPPPSLDRHLGAIQLDEDCTNSAIRAAAAAEKAHRLRTMTGQQQQQQQQQQTRDPRDEQIEQLRNRVQQLERLVELKNVQIVELNKQLDKFMELVYRPPENASCSPIDRHSVAASSSSQPSDSENNGQTTHLASHHAHHQPEDLLLHSSCRRRDDL